MERIFDVEQQYPDTEFKKYIHVSKLGIDSRLYNSYEACPDTIRLIVNSLEVYPTDSVVDIGCGKGYAMYAMAQKPFSQIDGIEICPHLAETALHNLSAIFGKGDRRFHIYTEDAALFDKWDDYTYAFEVKDECTYLFSVIFTLECPKISLRLLISKPSSTHLVAKVCLSAW